MVCNRSNQTQKQQVDTCYSQISLIVKNIDQRKAKEQKKDTKS